MSDRADDRFDDETDGRRPPSDPAETPPPEEAPPPGRRSRRALYLWLGGGVVVLAAALVLIVVFAFGPTGPSGVVDDYFGALKDGDMDELGRLTCAEDGTDISQRLDPLDNEEDKALWEGLFGGIEWDITGETVSGDRATVTVRVSGLGEDADDAPIDLVKENGDWKVCGAADTLTRG